MSARIPARPTAPNEPTVPTVLHVAWFNAPYGGGFVASLQALGARLARAGWRQVLALPQAAREREWYTALVSAGTSIHPLPAPGTLALARRVADFAERGHARILHAHFNTATVPVWLAARGLRVRGGRVAAVWHLHSPHPVARSPVRVARDLLKYRLMARAVDTIVVSPGGLVSMTERGLPPARAHVITNGIDLKRLDDPGGRTRADVRAAFDVSDADCVMLMSAWQPHLKGADVAVDAAQRVAARRGRVCLVAVGTEALHAFARARFPGGLPPWLRIVPPTEHFVEYLRAADLYLSASRVEGFPYAVAEAMAASLPVVASDIRGMEWTHDARGVVRFAGGSADALARALEDLLDRPSADRAAMGASNRALVIERHTVETWAERVFALYEAIISR